MANQCFLPIRAVVILDSEGVITYDFIAIGDDVMDKNQGIFTCGIGGTYYFSFSCFKNILEHEHAGRHFSLMILASK